MKKIIFSFITLTLLISGVYWGMCHKADKAWGDVNSLTHLGMQSGDFDTWWHNNTQYSVNWSDIKQFAKSFDPASGGTDHTGINWTSLGT